MDQLQVIWLPLLVALVVQTGSAAQKLTSFTFPTFTSTEKLLVNRDAEYMPASSSIWLNPKYNGSTNGLYYSCGEIIYAESVQMRSTTGLVASFNTSFTFSIAGRNSAGMAFMFAVENYTTGGAGASQCLLLKPQNGRASNHLFAVEFDTWKNPEFDDPSDNHVGVNVNSMNSTAVYNACGALTTCSYFDVDEDFTAWIEYDSIAQTAAVFLTKGSLVQNVSKPAAPVILAPHIDLSAVFNDHMYVGFTGSGAMFPEVKKIKSWSFRTGSFGGAGGADKRSSNSVGMIAGVVSGVLCALIIAIFCGACFVVRRRGIVQFNGSEHEALSMEFSSAAADDHMMATDETKNVRILWPREFSFQDLNVATNGFSEGSLLGEGGYGQVFKGNLSTSGYQYPVAVKRTRMKDSSRGSARDFLAELSVTSQIRHRNLIRLYGWCQENSNLLLVFEYMPNSSLERWLFDNSAKQPHQEKLLTWPQRQHIMTGVAAAIAYLHEGWNQCILHRDIKAANVLLDKDFNPHVGDFGLAHLTSHTKLGRTTAVAGTFGYLAPETAQDGKVTQKSDVYSFGILALEVASGRPVLRMNMIDGDDQEDVELVNLLGCVWHAHEKGELPGSVVDPRLLGSDFDTEQVRLMFQLGLLCCHPDPDARPVMRVVHRCMVDGEVAQLVATLPPSKPRVQYYVGGRAAQASSGSSTDRSHNSAGAPSSMNSQKSSSGLTWSSAGSVNQSTR